MRALGDQMRKKAIETINWCVEIFLLRSVSLQTDQDPASAMASTK
jgi:hypothetical protein